MNNVEANTHEPQVLIIGGGLSGLKTAHELSKRDIPFLLLEARNRFGGRILSKKIHWSAENRESENCFAFELGPSWFWPGQTRIQSLINELELQTFVFEQTSKGLSLYEDQDSYIHKNINGASMQGSYRIDGGMDKLVTKLVRKNFSKHYLTNACVTHLEKKDRHIETHFMKNEVQHKITSEFVVLALPPRLALTTINFHPSMNASRTEELQNIATWMAGQAKAVILYEHPFWHQQGLSGDVISHQGPLQEIHDASPANGSPFGLLGFFGIPPEHRKYRSDELQKSVIKQLVRLFGEDMSSPIEIFIKDWAFDPYTATNADQNLMLFQASNDINTSLEPDWDNRLIFSGTETAGMGERNNGYLEGALEASERSINFLLNQLKSRNSV